MPHEVYRGRYKKKYKRKVDALEIKDDYKLPSPRLAPKSGNLLTSRELDVAEESNRIMDRLELRKSAGLGRNVTTTQYNAVQRPKKKKKSNDRLFIEFDAYDAQDGVMDEHDLNDIAKMTLRRGLQRAMNMSPQELSERSKKGWETRRRGGKVSTPAKKPAGGGHPTNPKLDAPITRYGLKYRKGNDQNAAVRSAKTGLTDEQWRALPKKTFKPTELNPTEEFIGSKYVDRVVAGEPLREGYDPFVLIDEGGKAWIVDGHHRAAMYSALGRDGMPAHVLDLRKTKLRKALAKKTGRKILSASGAKRGGALIAASMSPDELSERSKKGWLKRQRARQVAAQVASPGRRRVVARNAKIAGSKEKKTTRLPDPTKVKSVKEMNTLLHRLASISNDAEAKGEAAPEYDLCVVSIPGTNLFCGDNRGIPRKKMPQLGGKPRPGSRADQLPRDKDGSVDAAKAFKDHLKETGVKMTPKRMSAASLKASQSELVGSKVAGMRADAELGKYDPAKVPIYVSRDGYVIDGHHRWAAVVGKDALDGKLDGTEMNVEVLDMDIDDALKFVNDFALDFGIMPKVASSVQKFDEFGSQVGLTDLDERLSKLGGCGCGCGC